jgi:diacylglycerol kinase (ATP)
MDVFAIVNPLSGAGANPQIAAERRALLVRKLSEARITGTVHLTERGGHARELAGAAVKQGAGLVIAWGGDGTINEIASRIAGSAVTLAVIPAGSGNGLANELGIPTDPSTAIDVALNGHTRTIDGGEINGRLFFNIAGIGFDACVAERFNAQGQGRRGLGPYVRLGLQEAFRYRAAHYRVILDGDELHSKAFIIAFANGREYGNRIRLAPLAKIDDGKLEALVVEYRPAVMRLWAARHLALGTAHKAANVVMRSIETAEVHTDGEIVYHVDGEIGRATGSVVVRIRPGALRVKVV